MSAAEPPRGADHASRDAPASPPRRRTDARNRRLLILIAIIGLAPVVMSYLAYYFFPRDARVNYGALLQGQAPVSIRAMRLDGTPFDIATLRGRWVVLFAGAGGCAGPCADALYASRQARTIQNAERDRVQRVWLIIDDPTPSPGVLAEHPDLIAVRVGTSTPNGLPAGVDRIYLIDPLGNFVLAWPSRPDVKAMARDLTRLLRASRIG